MNMLDRRGFFKSASIAALAATTATVTHAFQMPDVPPAPELPWWWTKLTGPTAEMDEEVFWPWQDTEKNRALANKLEELRELLFEIAPPEINAIQNISLQWVNEVPQNVNVIGRSGYYGEGLHMYRPEFGWLDKTPKIGGSV
ncbi:hypothetical protein [Citreimonas sp.]|uniref:hypothetical protein n=1 Tax=Citreimonas sp. TaxID=3036715 RepID=UPI00405820BD